MNRSHYRGPRAPIDGLRTDAPAVTRIPTDAAEIAVATFRDGARCIVVQTTAATSIVPLTAEQAEAVAAALRGQP
jgi:hypothetical protein